MRKALFPEGSRETASKMKLSPGLISGNHVFLTGMTGSRVDGSMPSDLREQFRMAFHKIEEVLSEANLDCSSIVEMTTYHVGLREHFDLFNEVRCEFVEDPFPAWTAVEVAGLRREGARVEIRVIAALT